MRILMLTQWFDPEPTFKGLLFAKEMKARGHEVFVVTGYPNYPAGKLYSGYKMKLYEKEDHDGIQVLRVCLFPSHDRNPIKRLLNYVSFCISSAFIGSLMIPKCDVAYVYHPPATVGIAAMFIKLFRRIPFVYDIQDLWPDTVMQSGMLRSSFIAKSIGAVCKIIYKAASHIVVLSPGFKKALAGRGVPKDKITVVYNWCDERAMRGQPSCKETAEKWGMVDKFNVVFAGNMGKAQGLDVVVEAAKRLELLPEVQFVLVGDGTEAQRISLEVTNSGLKNVIMHPQCPMSEIAEILSQADALLVHLEDDPLFRITIPSKTQAYMCIGKPLLMGVRGDAGRLVVDNDAGISFESSNVLSLVNAVRSLYVMDKQSRDALGKNARKAYLAQMSMKNGVDRILNVLAGITRYCSGRSICHDEKEIV